VKIDTIESRQNRKGSGDKLQAATEWLIVSYIGSHTPYVLFPQHLAKVLPLSKVSLRKKLPPWQNPRQVNRMENLPAVRQPETAAPIDAVERASSRLGY